MSARRLRQKRTRFDSNTADPIAHISFTQMKHKPRIKGGIIVFIGFMLSPLPWWNDLFVNVPAIARIPDASVAASRRGVMPTFPALF